MSPKSRFNNKLHFPVIFGSLLLGAYVLFSNRYNLLGDLVAQREVLFHEDKEARALCEEVLKEQRKS